MLKKYARHIQWSLAGGWTTIVFAFLTSCTPSKINQCNELISIINQTSDDLQSIQSGGRANRQNAEQLTTELSQFVNNLDKNTQAMQAIGVDASLQPLKDQLVAAYQTALQNSRALTDAIKTKINPPLKLPSTSSTPPVRMKQNYSKP